MVGDYPVGALLPTLSTVLCGYFGRAIHHLAVALIQRLLRSQRRCGGRCLELIYIQKMQHWVPLSTPGRKSLMPWRSAHSRLKRSTQTVAESNSMKDAMKKAEVAQCWPGVFFLVSNCLISPMCVGVWFSKHHKRSTLEQIMTIPGLNWREPWTNWTRLVQQALRICEPFSCSPLKHRKFRVYSDS